MSNIDKRALREAAKAVGKNDWQYVYTRDLSAPGRGYITVGGAEAIYCLNKATGGVKQSENVLRYIAAANPATFLTLLDELEAKDKRIAELEAKLANPVQLPKTNGYWTEQERAFEEAITLAKRQVRLAGFRCEGDE
ncbi:ead/Ea22-like family protein [Enterobacter hormaechei]|uniref:ead/Ea22-like family protein n=1 Tax=Enterobacter hormaechei TaxID=158836 RepID=UPI003344FF19